MSANQPSLTIEQPFDAHVHLRDGEMLKLVAPLSSASFAGAVAMPNLVPPVDSADLAVSYRERIKAAVPEEHAFEPQLMLFLREYSEEELLAAKPHILGVKLYPAGATTNSEQGVAELASMEPTLKRMEELDIPLLVHGEINTGFSMDRERHFADVYRHLARTFPKLRLTMEHITTVECLEVLHEFENIRATVTLQHLLADMDALIAGMLQPHWFCKPVLKRPEDREVILQAAIEGHPRLMFGSDSAPHLRQKKEQAGAAAGCFTAPQALPKLAELFEQHGALDKLQGFVSDYAHEHYRLDLPKKTVTLVKETQQVPELYQFEGADSTLELVPMLAGEEIGWSLADA